MLLNLSNHPSAAWNTAQTAAATALYGGITDMPFPNIPPDWTSAQVLALAQQYVRDIQTNYPNAKAVHLMGEMTFTTTLVGLLQRTGIACVASTSERLVEEKPDGQKVVTFRFVQFRDYPNFSA